MHARDHNGANSTKKEIFQNIISGIKNYAPELVLCTSLSGRYVQDKILRAEVLSLQPDMASLTMSSLNFPQGASINEPSTILWLIEEMKKYGVIPEIECFDLGMINYTNYLINKGIFNTPIYINVILGNLFSAGTDESTVAAIFNLLPKNAKICFGGIGKAQEIANLIGLNNADGVRIGIEDNFYLKDKILGKNSDFINNIHNKLDELGLKYMPSVEFKKLGYANRKVNSFR